MGAKCNKKIFGVQAAPGPARKLTALPRHLNWNWGTGQGRVGSKVRREGIEWGGDRREDRSFSDF